MIDYLPYVFVGLAAFFNAVMDTIENAPNYNKSIFRSLPQRFWLKEESWKYAPMIFGWRSDAWHISKSLMVIFIAAAIAFTSLGELIFRPWLTFIVLGLVWNGIFNFFYSFIFRLK